MRTVTGALMAAGVRVAVRTGRDLMLPIYDTEAPDRVGPAAGLLADVSRADGFLLSSPGYHGGPSGLLKNALDYLAETASEPFPYFAGRPVGLIATAAGWQAAVSTLIGLRTIVHALRGWPTPLGVAINTTAVRLDPAGSWTDPDVAAQLTTLAGELLAFLDRPRPGVSPP